MKRALYILLFLPLFATAGNKDSLYKALTEKLITLNQELLTVSACPAQPLNYPCDASGNPTYTNYDYANIWIQQDTINAILRRIVGQPALVVTACPAQPLNYPCDGSGNPTYTNYDLANIWIQQDSTIALLRLLAGGGGGNITGNLTAPHIPYASGVHTLVDGPLTVSGSNVIVPGFLLGTTGTYMDLNGSGGSFAAGRGIAQISINPTTYQVYLGYTSVSYLQGTKGLGWVLSDSLNFYLNLSVPTGISTDSVLVRDPVTGEVKAVSQSSLISGAWLLTGNAGTTPGTDFVGTTDNKDLQIKRDDSLTMQFQSKGRVNIGDAAINTTGLGILRVGQGNTEMDAGELASGYFGVWLNVTPTSNNFTLTSNGTTFTSFNTPQDTADMYFSAGNVQNPLVLYGNHISGSASEIAFQTNNRTHTTASTDAPVYVFSYGTDQRLTGAITTNISMLVASPTITATGASTITNAYNLYLDPVVAGSGITVTNNYVLGSTGFNVGATGVINCLSLNANGGNNNFGNGNMITGGGVRMTALVYYLTQTAAKAAGLSTGALYLSGVDSSVHVIHSP